LIKQARGLMGQKAYSEAAVSYEKYLRVLEMVYNLKKGELTPDVFNNSKRSKELTVVASVYWDLVRIYDTSPRYGDRMSQAASKLALFLPFSPIFPDVVKRAESFVRSAKNPQVMRSFLKAVRAGGGRCFIATAVFADGDCPEVQALRQFRDQVLMPSGPGRSFVFWYYRHSPRVADWITHRAWMQSTLRPPLRLIALAVKKSLNSGPDSYNS
ncbi:MAG: CFI-box-CTERM domain-containing protein, partial [Bdellovibrionales bacterium]